MQVCFIADAEQLVLPVTPARYNWRTGVKMETISISALGDVFRPGGNAPFSGSLEFLLPAHEYGFLEPEGMADPQYYLDRLSRWVKAKKPVRLIVTGTEVNCLVYLESLEHGEDDGSRDRDCTLSFREFVPLDAKEVAQTATGNLPRPDSGTSKPGLSSGQKYVVKTGDCLSMICRRFYGSGDRRHYTALATVNGIKNPHLIFPGKELTIPPEAELLGVRL